MKKWLLILLGIILLGCCAASESNSDKSVLGSVLVKKTLIHYHHTEDCRGHKLLVEKVTFSDNDHEMWIYYAESHFIGIVHSPECSKCNSTSTEVEEVKEESSSYWGW